MQKDHLNSHLFCELNSLIKKHNIASSHLPVEKPNRILKNRNHRVGNAANLPPNDKKFFLKIPHPEIDANENIDESVNANR